MTSGLKKFGLLLWKNWILQQRHKVQTLVEILVPLLFTAVLVGIRNIVSSDVISQPTIFEPFDVSDSNGTSVTKGCFLMYAPNNTATTDVIYHDLFQDAFPDYEFIGYDTENELLSKYKDFGGSCEGQGMPKNETNKNPVLAAIIFHINDGESWTDATNIKYSLRFPSTQHSSSELGAYGLKPRWMTELLYPIWQRLGPRDNPDKDDLYADPIKYQRDNNGGEPAYWHEGFLYVQQAVDSAFKHLLGVNVSTETIELSRFPYPTYIDDVFLVALQGFLPLIIVFSFIYSVINITKSVAHEKEKRLKESMKMMGLPNWLHWSAWFFKSYLFILISLIFITAILKIKWYPDNPELAVLTYMDGTVLFVFFLIYAFSMVTLSFFVSTLFSTANSAATAAGVIFFLSYFPYQFLQPRYDTLSKGTKLMSCLLSNTALSFGCQIISMFEGTGAGVQWDNIRSTVSPDDNFTMSDVMIMMLFDGFLYLFLAIYIEGVWPGEYGLPMPWYFPFTKWYWFGTPRGEEVSAVTAADLRQKKPQFFEKEPNAHAGVQIQGLTKAFGIKTAVNNLYLNFFDNQITVLLGHNGAGKTTTMSMLTGLFPPSSGTAIVNGFDIRNDIKSVRDNLGLCPQHDVLFDEMTVSEHLRFFARLKGCEGSMIEQEVDRMLVAVNLEVKKDAQAMSLSGGMKRRLSVGIAFVGGSRVVLLDEPSSGLDPGARRQIWDLIQKEKKSRTILLSTHFMDEADLLGDRIAIMAEGQVQCCGSSLFLKKKYGGGYHLIIVKEPHCDVEVVTSFLRQVIPDVVVDQNIGSELSYSLSEEMSYRFPDMFEELERRKEELGIASYGASITTMEEVFMRVGKQVEEEMQAEERKKEGSSNGHAGSSVSIPVDSGSRNKLYQDLDRNTGVALLWQQLRAMVVKKYLYTIRNRALLLAQTLIPTLFLMISLILLKTLPDVLDPPALDLTLKEWQGYGNVRTPMECNMATDEVCTGYTSIAKLSSAVVETLNMTEYFLSQAEKDLAGTNLGIIVGMYKTATVARGYFNSQPFHSPPVALNLLTNAFLRAVPNREDFVIDVINYPLPPTTIDEIDNIGNSQSSGFNIGFTISFGMSFLAAGFVVFLIKERETNAKHLQYVSGVRFPVFWIASFICDALNFIVPCIIMIILLLAFQSEDFKSAEMLGNVFFLLLMYGWGVIPLMYLFSFAFTIPSSGFTRMVLFNIFTGMATILAISILKVPELNLLDVANTLDWIFMIFPNYNLGYGISQLSVNKQIMEKCPAVRVTELFQDLCLIDPENSCCADYPRSYLGWTPNGIGRNILFLFLTGLVSFTIIFLKESEVLAKISCRCRFRKSKTSSTEDAENDLIDDSDVAAENARIRNTNLTQLFKTENLVLRDLTKQYGDFTAVNKLCLGVQKGECFGLLGINGAGKSTTFKMLTGDIPLTSGDAYIHESSVKTNIKTVQQQLGYCPQFDALIPELTGRETIRLFARLRGVMEDEIDTLAEALAAKLLFTQHIDKPCGTYSGGNKRKLSTALALVGNPRMVLLDEPTTGMDPVARRHLWDAIIDVREAGTSIVLTSHSMDECEALSTRLAIMVNGKFRCIGSTQHLKNKFGEGYTLVAQIETSRDERRMTRQSLELGRRRSSYGKNLQPWEKELQPLRNYIERVFPGAELKDIHAGYVNYHIKEPRITWGYMFKKMEEAKAEFRIEAYSVGQTTLEQVFLNFTKAQVNSDET